MNKYIYLSHFMDQETPGYGGACGFDHEEATSIKNGQSSNSLKLHLSNHSGTHIDFPKHFDDEGKNINDYAPEFWFFKKPYLIEIKVNDGEIITPEKLNLKSIDPDIDFLIIKTGFELKRSERVYWENNPGFSPDVGFYLRDHFKSLKAIGFDTISLTSYQNRPLGRTAHQAFLKPYKDTNPILIIEDMHLINLQKNPVSIICTPLLIKNADGVPVTVIAQI